MANKVSEGYHRMSLGCDGIIKKPRYRSNLVVVRRSSASRVQVMLHPDVVSNPTRAISNASINSSCPDEFVGCARESNVLKRKEYYDTWLVYESRGSRFLTMLMRLFHLFRK